MSMIFLCVHIANATNVIKCHPIPMKQEKKNKNKIETYIFWSVLTEEAHDELLLMGQTHSSALGWYPHSKKVKHKSANSQIQTDCVEPKGQDPMNKPQVFSDEWVTAIWAGWQIHADRKNCSSLFPPLRYSNSFIFLFFLLDIDSSTTALAESNCQSFKRLQMLLLWTSRQKMMIQYSFWRLWLYTCMDASIHLQSAITQMISKQI